MISTLSNIDALILCGGLGTRLKSTTGETPKVMAQVDGDPFLDILIEFAARQGGRRIVLCTGYKADSIEEYYREKKIPGVEIDFSREEEPLGTGGALKYAQRLVKSDPFLVLNGDSFCAVQLSEFLKFHAGKKARASMVLTEVPDNNDFGSVVVDQQDRITDFREKTAEKTARCINAGVYCFQKDIFDLMPPRDKFSLEKDFFPALIGQGFYGFKVQADFIDIGTPERYQKAQEILRKVRE